MTIKFNLYNISNGEQKEKVHYSLDSRTDGRKCVTIYSKGYGDRLSKFFAGVHNDSDLMTDYFAKDTVRIFEGDKHYAAARATAERLAAKWDARFEKKYGKPPAAFK